MSSPSSTATFFRCCLFAFFVFHFHSSLRLFYFISFFSLFSRCHILNTLTAHRKRWQNTLIDDVEKNRHSKCLWLTLTNVAKNNENGSPKSHRNFSLVRQESHFDGPNYILFRSLSDNVFLWPLHTNRCLIFPNINIWSLVLPSSWWISKISWRRFEVEQKKYENKTDLVATQNKLLLFCSFLSWLTGFCSRN